jgi:hypothetical protein
MAWISDDGTVSVALEHRDGVEIQGIAGGGFKSADTAFAQHDLVIPTLHHVFGGLQKLL